jgi:hypothetical protein
MAAVTSGVVVGAGSALLQNRAANKATAAANRASNQANALQTQIYDQARSDLAPYQQAGTNALTGLNALAAGDYSGFNESPDYKFALQQGLQAVDRSAAARGSMYSGGNLVDLNNYAQGAASQNLGNYRNSLMNLANMGASSSSALAGVGQNYAGAYGQNLNNSAYAQGSAALSQGNNWSQALAGLGGLANNYVQGRQSAYNPQGNLLAGQMTTGQGSAYNFGNNLSNFKGRV